jgi:acetylornithine deacetylase/succinyl-diaminopimelate desuccinylase-like protein
MTVFGPGGHGSSVVKNNALRKAANIIERINANRMPVHITPPVRAMVEGMAKGIGGILGNLMKLLLNPKLTDKILNQLGEVGLALLPMFHNTVNATIIQGGEKINVIPCEITIYLDGRMLPSMRPDDLIAELRDVIGYGEEDVEIEVENYEPCPPSVDMGAFDILHAALKELDPDGNPVPMLLTAVTDGRHLAKLGIQSYGFIPMQLPEDFEFFKVAHAEDERVPVDSIEFGVGGIYKVIRTYKG